MSTAAVRGVFRQLGLDGPPPTDAALLTRYARQNDQAAFAELLRRYGPVVLGVCRRVLADPHAAEDAFQATFLVLARKAASIRPPGAVGGWLYGVAVRTARKAKVAAARRWRREMARALANPGGGSASRGCEPPETAARAELRAVLDEELGRLPEKLRGPVVLCDLHGKSRSAAAAELGWPEGTVAARLAQARKLLAARLSRRGVALPGAGLAALLTPEVVSADLARATLASAEAFAAGAASSAVPPAVLTLAEGVLRTMTTGKLKLALVTALAGGLLAGALWGTSKATPGAGSGEPAAPPAAEEPAAKPVLPGYVSRIEFSTDGKRYSVVAGEVTVRDPAGRTLYTVPGEAAGFSADGQTLFVMGQKVLECDAATGKVLKEYPRPKTNVGWHLVAFSPDGKRYAAHFGFDVRVYDTATGFEPVRLDGQHEPGGSAIAGITGKQLLWSPDGKQVAAVGVLVKPGVMGLAGWEVETGKRFYSFETTFEDGPLAAAFSRDSKAIAIGYKGHVDVWTGGLNRAKKHPTVGPVTALAFGPDGKLLAAAIRKPIPNPAGKEPPVIGHKTEVQLLSAESGQEMRRFDGFEGVSHTAPTKLPVAALAFSPDGTKLVAGTGLPPVTPVPNDLPRTGEVRVFTIEPSR